jgi:hypothetical protein
VDEGDAYLFGPGYDDALSFGMGVVVLLLLAPTLIWITWVLLRRCGRNRRSF